MKPKVAVGFFTITKTLARVAKNKREITTVTNIRNEKVDIITSRRKYKRKIFLTWNQAEFLDMKGTIHKRKH